jgi:hypothetical protein
VDAKGSAVKGQMSRALARIRAAALLLGIVVISSAHVGSPNVVFDGSAGPYPVRVVVRPPEVVPGLAEVIVRVNAPDASRVDIKPVFWKAGVAGAPAGDDMKPVAGQRGVYDGQLWLMAYGAYSVYVTVTGARGTGVAIVPVNSFATGRLPLGRGLEAILAVLAALLVAGLLTIIHAASGESLVPPGETFDAPRRRRANVVTAVAAPLLALLIFGGARWWGAEDARYQRNMYASPSAVPTITSNDSHRTLRLVVRDTAPFRAIFAPVIPDHGKTMHLFLISLPDMRNFAHLHPSQLPAPHLQEFTGEISGVPAGHYRLFGDITLDNGLSLTVTNTVDVPESRGPPMPSDPDDSWTESTDPVPILGLGAMVPVGGGYTIGWSGATPIEAGKTVDLRFMVRNAQGETVQVQPYLGMAAHAAVVRSDASVFIHLHPMGTVATVAQQAFSARDRGDTTARGRIRPGALEPPPMPMMSMSGALDFPYEFPKSGRYRIWVQVNPVSQVLTAAFDVDVR